MPGTSPAMTSAGGCNETVFVLAFAGDLPRAHRAKPYGAERGSDRGRSYERSSARSEIPRGQSNDGPARADRRRRPGAVRVVGDHRIYRRDASQAATTTERSEG